MILKGLHHVSSITADAAKNYHFYTKVLGLRLVKKSVNQDDISVYHLYYGDEIGNPGTVMTFFEIPMAGRNHEGVNSISAVSFRVPDDEALHFWKERFERLNVQHEGIRERAGRLTLAFRDGEGHRMILVSDENNRGVQGGRPWERSVVPRQYAIRGLGPAKLTVADGEKTAAVLTELLGFRKKGEYPSDGPGGSRIQVFETGEGGTGAEVHVEERKDLPRERLGRGGVHHVAFRVENEEELHEWVNILRERNIPNSGFVDRFYFRSLYFRDPNGILFELATDGPGFVNDEEFEHLGESLALPPFLEPMRERIESVLKPLDTVWKEDE